MATFSDPFTGTGTLGSNWTHDAVFTGLVRTSDQAHNPVDQNNFAIAWVATGAATFTADHYAQITASIVGALELPGPAVRCATSQNYYYVHCSTDSAQSQVEKVVAGSASVIREIGVAFANGDTCKLSVSGTTLKVYRNGAQEGADITDSSLASGQPGFKIYSAAGTARGDDFDAADLAAGSSSVSPSVSPSSSVSPSPSASVSRSPSSSASASVSPSASASPSVAPGWPQLYKPYWRWRIKSHLTR